MIRLCNEQDFEQIWTVINDGAQTYQGVIPEDRLSDPYMSKDELRHEIAAGIVFGGVEDNETMVGMTGIQPVQDVTLIRHAYVRTTHQKRGIGKQLLSHLRTLTSTPVLIGTWAS